MPQCGPVCFCVWRYCVCESRPLTAAELSLIQLCLLSCLPAAAAPGSVLALPQLSPPGLRPASRPGLWPASGSQSLLLGAFSVSASEGSCLFLHVSTCPSSSIFFFSAPVPYSVNKPLIMPPTHSATPQPLCRRWRPEGGSDPGPAPEAWWEDGDSPPRELRRRDPKADSTVGGPSGQGLGSPAGARLQAEQFSANPAVPRAPRGRRLRVRSRGGARVRTTFWSWDPGPKQRERQQGLSSWAVPPSALGFSSLALAWEPGDQRQGCGCSGPSKDREARLGLVNRRCRKVVAEQNPRDGSKGQVQNHVRFQALEESGGQWALG